MIPKPNEADLEDLPQEVLKQLDIHTVETIDEVLPIALHGASFADGKLRFGELPGAEEAAPRRRKRSAAAEPAEPEPRLHAPH